jgi:signal transduction histidine kinase
MNEAELLEAPQLSSEETDRIVLDGVSALAGRLEDPVAKLGDVVRTVAGLIEQAGSESQLPRLADIARSRVTTIEALTQDLVHAAQACQPRFALVATVDVRKTLQHAGGLASGPGHSDDLVLDLPDEPVTIDWPAAPLNRALTLLVTTATNHRGSGARVTVRLTSVEDEALITVDLTGARIPFGELLRVIGHFRDRNDEELPLGASSSRAGTTAGNSLITATATSTGTTFVVRLPR